jgi:hypothetical protein
MRGLQMKDTCFLTQTIKFILVVMLLAVSGCKELRPPVLNDISIKGVSSRSITLEDPILSDAGNPQATVSAYIGLSGKIREDGPDVTDMLEGPVDVSKGSYQFNGLATGQSYDIIVVAKNTSGDSVKSITGVMPAVPEIDPAAYPEISNDEMGIFRWYLSVCDDPITDFSRIESFDKWQGGLSSYRYSLAFMTYFLTIEQYHKIPACPEIIKPRMDRLIQKMIERPVWSYWADTSRGIEALEPFMNRPYPEAHDPVGLKNIMYSGHLGHMIASYEMLYRDLKWSEPGSIVFKWSDDEAHVYDNNSLQRAMYNQMANNPHKSIECEPNAVFPECNEHPILSFMLYDHVHGTNYGEARKAFMDFFLLSRMISPITHETCLFYLVKQKTTLSQEFASFGNGLSLFSVPLAWLGVLNVRTSVANGWNGTFMHAWQPEFIERHYEFQKKRRVIETDSNTAYIKTEMILDQIATPFFAMLASEVGDLELRDKLVAWCKDYYKPVWVNDMLSYPVREPVTLINPRKGFTPTSQALTGILIAYAMANTKDGQRMVIEKPFTDRNFSAPKVSGIDFPNVLPNRAIYDFEKESLIVTVSGGALKTGNTVLNISQLDPARQWALITDGQLIRRFTGVSSIPVEVSLDKTHDIVLIAE